MAIKKREQIVIVAISAVVAILAVHLLVFSKRAKEYNEVAGRFNEGKQKLDGAESATPMQIQNFKKKTAEYETLVTSVTTSLNIDYTTHFSDMTGDGITARVSETTSLVKQLVDLRRSVAKPVLSFLDNRTDPRYPGVQFGWNLPQGLPANAAKGAIWDNVVKLADRFELLKNIPNPIKRMEQRYQYNLLLGQIGINAAEVSDYVYFYSGQTPIFFNDSKWLSQLPGAKANDYYGLLRMGPAVPRLRKMWQYDLLLGVRDPQSPVTPVRLLDVLDLSPEYFPYDVTLSHVNRQLRALIDVIKAAERNEVVEIYQVNLLKPVDFAKVEARVPNQSPTPAPSPDPSKAGAPAIGMGAARPVYGGGGGPTPVPTDQKVGKGTGLEISFRATNTNMTKFLFDLGTTPRTYSVDDVYISASPDGILNTSATLELLIELDKLAPKTQ